LGRLGHREQDYHVGMLLHSVLAIEPLEQTQARVLGLAWGKLWSRRSEVAPVDETSAQRRKRSCESARWVEAVAAIGAAPPQGRFVHVGDREADIFDLYRTCQSLAGVSFLIRCRELIRHACIGHNTPTTPIPAKDRPKQSLRDLTDALPALGGKSIWLPP